MIGTAAFFKNRFLKKIYEHKGIQDAILQNLDVSENIDEDAPLEEAEYVVIDTELTGLKIKKDSIVSLGAVRMSGKKIDIGNNFYRLVEPRTELTGKSIVIHEITPGEVAEWPDIEALLPEFIEFCGSRIVVGHMVAIDLGFINMEMKRLYGFPLQNPAVDTYKLYRWLRKKEEECCAYYGGLTEEADLFTLAKKYEIPVNGVHHALKDAFVAAQLFQRLITALPRFGIRTISDLLGVGKPAR
jgi:DNA polymerase-3 subunit epsilon